MAPEQAMGQRVDHRADLFSLGAVLYTMCTGQSAFAQTTAYATIRSVCDDSPNPIQRVNPDVPLWLADLVGQLMVKDPDQRIQTASQVVEIFNSHIYPHFHSRCDHKPPSSADVKQHPHPSDRHARPRVPRFVMLGLEVAVVLLVGIMTLMVLYPAADGIHRVDLKASHPLQASITRSTNNDGLKKNHGASNKFSVGSNPDLSSGSQPSSPISMDSPPTSTSNSPLRHSGSMASPIFKIAPASTGIDQIDDQMDDQLVGQGYDSLSEAVAAARDGDTIEIQWTGQLAMLPLEIHGKALRLRAADGFEPILVSATSDNDPLVTSNATLVLEGLAFEHLVETSTQAQPQVSRRSKNKTDGKSQDKTRIATGLAKRVLIHASASVYATNCRFALPPNDAITVAGIRLTGSHTVHLDNCELYVGYGGAVYLEESGSAPEEQQGELTGGATSAGDRSLTPKVILNHCVHSGFAVVSVARDAIAEVEITRNTLTGGCVILVRTQAPPGIVTDGPSSAPSRVRIQGVNTVFDTRSFVVDPSLTSQTMTIDRIAWQGQRNVFSFTPLVSTEMPRQTRQALSIEQMLAWKKFLGPNLGTMIVGNIHYANRLRPRLRAALKRSETLTPSVFQIANVRRARGRAVPSDVLAMFGADLEFVGPGVAYERFKLSESHTAWNDRVHGVMLAAIY